MLQRPFRQYSIIALAAASASVLAWNLAEPVDLRTDRSFEISADSGVKVIEIHHVGGLARRSTSFEVYGDGRIVASQSRTRSSEPPTILFEESISHDELLGIFTDLTASDVLEVDWRSMRDRFRGAPRPTDSSSTFITLRLTRYRQRTPGPSGFIVYRFAGDALNNYARELPDIRELAAVGRLLDRMNGLWLEHARQ